MKSKIFLVDDHPLVREWLANLINDEPDLEVCGQADSAQQALAMIGSLKPEVLIVDISLDSGSGLELVKDAKAVHDMSGHGMEATKPGDVSCSPTWVQPSADGNRIFVACNKSSDIVEIDVASWAMTRRIPAGDGVYNLATTHDGKYLITTNKRGKSASIIDIASGKEAARVPTSRRIASGVAISSDDRYAFVTQEGVGSEPGAVDVIDLRTLAKVATIDIGQQAGGIDFWKVTAPR